MKKKIILSAICAFIFILVTLIIYNFSHSTAQLLFNDVEVEENTELTYYLKVYYDGVDKYGVTSDYETTSQVNSGIITVEDKVPDGLTFIEFVTGSNGTVGAVENSNPDKSCLGKVIDDGEETNTSYHGLHYDEETRIVSFKVENLQAGCYLTIGIKTRTPYIDDPDTPIIEDRRDFYNFAQTSEGEMTKESETVHAYMGNENTILYNVKYEYSGEIPENAPTLPISNLYAENSKVAVNLDPKLEGYTFSGWSTNDVEVNNNIFNMPSNDVTFTGSFIRKQDYEVKYKIEGNIPDGYVLPSTKRYYSGSNVYLDELKAGDVIGNYKFSGWENKDLEISENNYFLMPNNDIELVGSFEELKYELKYEFYDTVLPPNYEELLPEAEMHSSGEKVTLKEPNTVQGYKFLGWYSEYNITMPEEDITIYGEWTKQSGTFAPVITKEIVDRKDSYHNGDKVKFKITVTNNEDYEIKNVILRENLTGVYFTEGEGYTIDLNNYANIPSIYANSSIVVYAEYTASNDITKEYVNEVELIGALADNDYVLDTSKEYKSSVSFIVSNIKLSINKVNRSNEQLEGAEYNLYSDRTCNNEVSSGLEFDLNPNTTYYLRESKAPTGYQISNSIIEINVSSNGIVTADNYNIDTNNGNNVITLIDDKINLLPNTGGIGNYVFIISGLILAIGSYILYKKRGGNK